MDKGFTLIELFIVTSIIGIILAVAIPMYQEHRQSQVNPGEHVATPSGAKTREWFMRECIADRGRDRAYECVHMYAMLHSSSRVGYANRAYGAVGE